MFDLGILVVVTLGFFGFFYPIKDQPYYDI